MTEQPCGSCRWHDQEGYARYHGPDAEGLENSGFCRRFPPYPTSSDGGICGPVRLSYALIDAVKAQAAAEGKEPSHLVEEFLWQVLSDRRSSRPP